MTEQEKALIADAKNIINSLYSEVGQRLITFFREKGTTTADDIARHYHMNKTFVYANLSGLVDGGFLSSRKTKGKLMEYTLDEQKLRDALMALEALVTSGNPMEQNIKNFDAKLKGIEHVLSHESWLKYLYQDVKKTDFATHAKALIDFISDNQGKWIKIEVSDDGQYLCVQKGEKTLIDKSWISEKKYDVIIKC